MRFLHTSDWHLGRIFHGKSLLEDQHWALESLREIVATADIDALFISGDVYDRAIPPVEAISLLDWFLSEIILSLGVPTVLIAGNHDSPERLGFGARLFTNRGLHLMGAGNALSAPLVLEDHEGICQIYGVPYKDPIVMRHALEAPEINDHETAMKAALARLLDTYPIKGRSVLLAHAFVAGGEISDSERPLSVAGAGTIHPSVFSMFDYTALGHLHRPQSVGTDRIQYSGSLLRYSFSELNHGKSVNLIDLGPRGTCEHQRISLMPRRQLRQIRGTLQDLLGSAPRDPQSEDYLLVSLEDEGPCLDPLGKLRPFYPNVLHVERLNRATHWAGNSTQERQKSQSDGELFEAFFNEVTGSRLNEIQKLALNNLLENWRREEEQEAST